MIIEGRQIDENMVLDDDIQRSIFTVSDLIKYILTHQNEFWHLEFMNYNKGGINEI